MYQETIYHIRENKDLYLYLKYNSHLYKNIFRNELNIKDLKTILKQQTPNENKIKNIAEKIEMINTFLSILK